LQSICFAGNTSGDEFVLFAHIMTALSIDEMREFIFKIENQYYK
jgi:hypothetical protein